MQTNMILTTFVVAGIVIFIFDIIEMILMHAFVKFTFYLGIPIIKRTIEIPLKNKNIQYDEIYRGSEGKFKFSPNNKIYFLSQIFLTKLHRAETAFSCKMIGTLKKNNEIDVVARLPIGTSLFVFLFLAIWTTVSIMIGTKYGMIQTISLGAIGWIGTAIVIGASYKIEKNRIETMINDLKLIINHT